MSGNSKPKTCSKVKNACKYCLEQVTNKNGLQCQGACKKWAHFKCLSYTPGKISDIKAGIIKVMCPCPDCETTQVKEFLTHPPYSCSNQTCPANSKGPIKCDSIECPSNRKKNTMLCSNKACSNDAAEYQNQAKKIAPRSVSPLPRSCMSPVAKKQPKKQPSKSPKKPPKKKSMSKVSPSNSSGSCQLTHCSQASIYDDEPEPKNQAAMVNALQEMCGTVGKLSVQIKDLMGKINKLS